MAAGEREGKVVAITFVALAIGSLASPIVEGNDRIFNFYIIAVDLLIFLVIGPVALWGRFFWPLWVLGFHVSNFITDLLIVFEVGWSLEDARLLHEVWSIPELVVMTFGIFVDQVGRKVRRGGRSKRGRARRSRSRGSPARRSDDVSEGSRRMSVALNVSC